MQCLVRNATGSHNKAYSSLLLDIKTTKREYSTTKREYSTTKHEYSTMKSEYNTMKREYSTMKREYSTIQTHLSWYMYQYSNVFNYCHRKPKAL